LRLLPDNPELGWTPYAWLVYLGLFVAYPGMKGTAAPRDWALMALGLALFLPLYFRGFWERGPRVVAIAAAIDVLGFAYVGSNNGALAFFIYAAAFLGRSGETSRAVRLLGAHLVLVAAGAWLLRLPLYVSLPGLLFSLIIGGVNIHYAGLSRANARLRAAHQEIEHLATVAERERIARDLHDLLGHTLSVIVLKSELASKLAERDPQRAAAEIRDVERISRETLAEVRAAVRGYRSSGLQQELARARSALEAAGVSVDCDAQAVELDASAESVLALALREAVTNVVRHAGARSCRVRLQRNESSALLEVEDDGRGGLAPEGIGLLGMRERIQALGGSLERNGERGTRLRIRLPLRGAA
jgi:two-component system sensor histidine kinase DesK